jgi:ADP-heptose:LPS heptosyltransferase
MRLPMSEKSQLFPFNRLIYWFKYPLKLWIFECIDQWILRKIPAGQGNKILITRVDLIGDYLVCRPFFKALKEAPAFRHRQIIFAGNQICKNLAENLDADVFEECIWLDRSKFINSIFYRFRILKSIRESGISTVINLSHTPQFFLESIVRVSGAKEKIRSSGTGKYMQDWEITLSAGWYSRTIETGPPGIFEFYRNHRFFACIAPETELPVSMQLTSFPGKDLFSYERTYFVLAPGASSAHRKWPLNRFAELGRWFYETTRVTALIAGGPEDREDGDRLIALMGFGENMAGKLSLVESMAMIAGAKILIGNESAPVHMAATTGTPTLCLSQGNHFSRWNPYPESLAPQIKTIYPEKFYPLSANFDKLKKELHDYSDFPIGEVSTNWAIRALKEMGF